MHRVSFGIGLIVR